MNYNNLVAELDYNLFDLQMLYEYKDYMYKTYY